MLGVILAYASVAKLLRRQRFIDGTSELLEVSPLRVRDFWWIVPAAEAACAAGLQVATTRRAALVLTIWLLLAFTGVLLAAIAGGTRASCACFGLRSVRPVGFREVVRNCCLVAVATLALNLDESRDLADSVALASVGTVGLALVATPVLLHAESKRVEVTHRRAIANERGEMIRQRGTWQADEFRELFSAGYGPRPTALLFIADDCPPCRLLVAEDLTTWRSRAKENRLRLKIVRVRSASTSIDVHEDLVLSVAEFLHSGPGVTPALVIGETAGDVIARYGLSEVRAEMRRYLGS